MSIKSEDAGERRFAGQAFVLGGTVVVLAIVLPVLASLAVGSLSAEWHWRHHSIHIFVEAVGATAAITLAILLLLVPDPDGKLLGRTFIACGLIGMGILDVCHACVSPGDVFVWLHSVAALVGGLFFGLAWLPLPLAVVRIRRSLALATASAATLLGVGSIALPELVPTMVEHHTFTFPAKAINFSAGAGFLIGALRFGVRLAAKRSPDDAVFCGLSLLFAVAGFTFSTSSLFDAPWWLWHAFRFVACMAGLCYVFSLYRQSRRDIVDLNRRLERRAAEAEGLRDAMAQKVQDLERAGRLASERAAALKESEEKYRTLYESSKDGIVFTNMKGQILDVNQAFVDMLGYSKQEIRRLTYQQLTPAIWHGMEEDIVKTQLLARGYSDEYEKEYFRKDGTSIPISIRIWLIADEAGEPCGMWGIVRDTADRKRADARVREVAADLKRSNEDLEQFAYVVSHDLKAPLRAMSSLATWIAEDYREALGDEGRENVDLLVNRARRMRDMIDGILQYSKVGRSSGVREWIVSDQMVGEVIDSLAPPDSISVHVDGALPEVTCERTQLKQVFQNLIGNAIKHLGKPQGQVTVSCRDAKSFWEFRVQDNGPGIAEEHFDRIFELFQTLKPRDELEATGVGLAVARRIVERHGGSIRVESIVGKGSQFAFTVPKDDVPDDSNGGSPSMLIGETDDARSE